MNFARFKIKRGKRSEIRTGRSNGEIAVAVVVTILSLVACYFIVTMRMYN